MFGEEFPVVDWAELCGNGIKVADLDDIGNRLGMLLNCARPIRIVFIELCRHHRIQKSRSKIGIIENLKIEGKKCDN